MIEKVERALSIFIAKYPLDASPKVQTAISAFVLAINQIYRTRLTAPRAKSRDTLTEWAQEHFNVWLGADKIVSSPKLWGPIVWEFLFDVASRYRHSVHRECGLMLSSLVRLLPCPECAGHFKRMVGDNVERWHRVRTKTDCIDFVQWMRDTVRARVKTEKVGKDVKAV